MPQVHITEEVGMNLFGVLTGTGQPEANRHVRVTEEQLGICESQTEIDGEEDLGDVGGWGAQAIEGGAAATGEAFATGLTAQPLNAIRAAPAITDQSVNGRIRVAEVVAVRTWAGVASGAAGLGLTACALALTPGQDARFADVAD